MVKERKLNDCLDINNPAHVIATQQNNENEKLHGKYHSKCGLYQVFCRCKKETKK